MPAPDESGVDLERLQKGVHGVFRASPAGTAMEKMVSGADAIRALIGGSKPAAPPPEPPPGQLGDIQLPNEFRGLLPGNNPGVIAENVRTLVKQGHDQPGAIKIAQQYAAKGSDYATVVR